MNHVKWLLEFEKKAIISNSKLNFLFCVLLVSIWKSDNKSYTEWQVLPFSSPIRKHLLPLLEVLIGLWYQVIF